MLGKGACVEVIDDPERVRIDHVDRVAARVRNVDAIREVADDGAEVAGAIRRVDVPRGRLRQRGAHLGRGGGVPRRVVRDRASLTEATGGHDDGADDGDEDGTRGEEHRGTGPPPPANGAARQDRGRRGSGGGEVPVRLCHGPRAGRLGHGRGRLRCRLLHAREPGGGRGLDPLLGGDLLECGRELAVAPEVRFGELAAHPIEHSLAQARDLVWVEADDRADLLVVHRVADGQVQEGALGRW